jgi:AhpD family alkylhydroperoxidase
MPNHNPLTDRERALVALGASVAAGCEPCTAYHVKAARGAGACDRSVALAVATALAGRNGATRIMGEWAERCQGSQPELDAEFLDQKRLITYLTSIATAVAVNSAPDLQRHLAAAGESGARLEQIQSAIEIARQVKRTAEDKIEAITSRLAADAQPATARSTGSGCCGADPVDKPQATAGMRTDCGCR